MAWGLLDEQVGGLQKLFVDTLTERVTSEQRREMATELQNWLKTKARVKPLPDLQQRIEQMCKSIDRMVESVKFEWRHEEIVVTCDGANEQTLRAFVNGTDWFDPCNDVVSVMISALRK